MKPLYLLVLLIALSSSLSFAQIDEKNKSLLAISADEGLTVTLNQAVTIASIQDGADGWIWEDPYWQFGKPVAKAKLDYSQPFCSLHFRDMYYGAQQPTFILPSMVFLAQSSLGRLSSRKGFVTRVEFMDNEKEEAMEDENKPIYMACEAPVSIPREIKAEDVNSITGGAITVKISDEFQLNAHGLTFVQMIMENKDGYLEFVATHTRWGARIISAKVELVTPRKRNGPFSSTTVYRYTVISSDSLGTDTGGKRFKWIVTSTETCGYGCSYKFKNELIEITPSKHKP